MNAMIDDIFVGSVMTSDVQTMKADKTVTEACKIMDAYNIGSVIITSDKNMLEGIITRSDIVSLIADSGNPNETTVSDVMSVDVTSVSVQEQVITATHVLSDNNIHHLPVTDNNGTVLGIITTADVTAYMTTF